MKRLTLSAGEVFLLVGHILANDGATARLGDFLDAARIPPGYQVSAEDLKAGDKTLGRMIVVSKPNQVSKVLVRVEETDRSAIPARRAAAKGYINGTASSLAESGYRVVGKKLPDIDKASFDKPITADLVVANGEGKKLWAHLEIFFTDKGFMVQVVAEDRDSLATLTDWAKTIKPRTNR